MSDLIEFHRDLWCENTNTLMFWVVVCLDVFVFVLRVAKHMQKSVPVKATNVRGSGGVVGPAVQHKQPSQSNPVVAGTPVAVTSQQRPPSGAASSLQSVVMNRPPAASSISHPAHEQLLRHELHKLQKEKERLRREQEEAVRRVSFICSVPFGIFVAQTPVRGLRGSSAPPYVGSGAVVLPDSSVDFGDMLVCLLNFLTSFLPHLNLINYFEVFDL